MPRRDKRKGDLKGKQMVEKPEELRLNFNTLKISHWKRILKPSLIVRFI
jgi:hypothetical protein